MRKTNLIKMISILLVSAMVILFTSNVYAANDVYDDLTLLNNTNSASTSTNTTNNVTSNSTANTTNNTANTTNKTNNSSVYTNTNLPKTGLTDSIPVAALIVILGISAVYAYKKVKDYKNI